MDKLAELGITFRVVPLSSIIRNSIYKLIIEANVIGTDDVVMDRRNHWVFGYLKNTKTGIVLTFEINSSINKRIRIHKEFRSQAAQKSLKKVEQRISYLVAPRLLRAIQDLEFAQNMFEEIHDQMVVYSILDE